MCHMEGKGVKVKEKENGSKQGSVGRKTVYFEFLQKYRIYQAEGKYKVIRRNDAAVMENHAVLNFNMPLQCASYSFSDELYKAERVRLCSITTGYREHLNRLSMCVSFGRTQWTS